MYSHTGIVVLAICFSLPIFCVNVYSVVVLLLQLLCCKCKYSDKDYPYIVIRKVFPILEQGSHKRETVLHGYKIPARYIVQQYETLEMLLILVVTTFFRDFILQKVSKADSDVCFDKIMLLNCTTYFYDCDGSSMDCYKISFDYRNAFNSAVGILAIYYAMANLMLNLSIKRQHLLMVCIYTGTVFLCWCLSYHYTLIVFQAI